jgi:hypothetical protein
LLRRRLHDARLGSLDALNRLARQVELHRRAVPQLIAQIVGRCLPRGERGFEVELPRSKQRAAYPFAADVVGSSLDSPLVEAGFEHLLPARALQS